MFNMIRGIPALQGGEEVNKLGWNCFQVFLDLDCLGMSRHKCTKEWYKAYLQASRMLYSGLALSEVSPYPISHDSISRWLNDKCFRPRDLWEKSQ